MPYQGYNKCQLVRETSQFVVSRSSHVRINQENIKSIAEKFHYKKFNQYEHHLVQQNDETFLKYIFVLDSCNFCFWPLEGFQYEQLAANIRKYINTGVSLQTLATITQQHLIQQMFSGIKVPLSKQRARLVREVCSKTIYKFNGSFKSIIEQANKSAVELVNILTANFPNFQDHQIYEGHQIHFYKRAQILVAGIWGKYQGKGLGEFVDIDQITMFADYRVPQILNEYKIMEYSKELQYSIEQKVELCSGCKEQVEIRAATIIAVERIKDYINDVMGVKCITLEVDHFLWQLGESMLGQIVPHHRTLTIYY